MKTTFKLTAFAILTLLIAMLFSGCRGEMELKYRLLDDGTYLVSLGDTPFPGRVTIPETYRGKPVTVLDYSGSSIIEAYDVTIPSTIKEASKGTLIRFKNVMEYEDGISYVCGWAIDCERGKSFVKLREGTIGIASDFLDNNPDATTLECPSTLRYIAKDALDSGRNLESVRLNDGLEYIGERAFYQCSSLKELVLPDSLTTLSSRSFWKCTALKKIVLPTSVTEVYKDTFLECPTDLTIYYRGTQPQFNSIKNIETEKGTFIQYYYARFYSSAEPLDLPPKYWFFLDGYPILWSEYLN